MNDARVILWGRTIGAVTWIPEREFGVFQYDPEFASTHFQVSPIRMPLSDQIYQFPELPKRTFNGLPGLLSDSLPDKFGTDMINAWLATQGRAEDSMSPIERLCYIGNRGMGALEFMPYIEKSVRRSQKIEIAALIELSERVVNERNNLQGVFLGVDDRETIEDIIRVGTSAGGARPKAVLAWNEKTGEFRSGQLETNSGFTHWIMKFDGIDGNKSKEVTDPKGFCLIEYAYHLMALEAGINMMHCRLHTEGGRSHFMTKRFDRTDGGSKLHMQSLAAIMHYDFNQPGAYSYEQALQAMIRLDLPMEDIEEQFRRAVFNIIGRNQDDHVKNISFLMNKSGDWRLSPGYDITYALNTDSVWTNKHQMSANNKRENFTIDDLIEMASIGNIKPKKAEGIVEEVDAAISNWINHAEIAGVFDEHIEKIGRTFRYDILGRS